MHTAHLTGVSPGFKSSTAGGGGRDARQTEREMLDRERDARQTEREMLDRQTERGKHLIVKKRQSNKIDQGLKKTWECVITVIKTGTINYCVHMDKRIGKIFKVPKPNLNSWRKAKSMWPRAANLKAQLSRLSKVKWARGRKLHTVQASHNSVHDGDSENKLPIERRIVFFFFKIWKKWQTHTLRSSINTKEIEKQPWHK